jgi:SAM-dependent methyltransferase
MLFGLLRRHRDAGDVEPAARPKASYQLRRKPKEKFELILPVLERHGVQSVLDVGCNAGVITRLAGQAGFFAVGIDHKVNTFGIPEPLEGACLGQVRFDLHVAEKIPKFDAVLLLSVYHQWIHRYGDELSQAMLRALAKKAGDVLVIELSGRAMKYGYEIGEHFTDHDDDSVVAHWRDYLDAALPAHETTHIGKSWEKKSEPFRYLFSCSPRSCLA